MTRQIEMTFTPKPPEMDEKERRVWRVLQRHRGRASAVKKASLSRICRLHERELRTIIKALVERYGRSIGSISTYPAGYYVIETEEELAEAINEIHGRAMSLLFKEKQLRGATSHQIARQVEIELEVPHDHE